MKTHTEIMNRCKALKVSQAEIGRITGASLPTVRKWLKDESEMFISQAIKLNDFLQ